MLKREHRSSEPPLGLRTHSGEVDGYSFVSAACSSEAIAYLPSDRAIRVDIADCWICNGELMRSGERNS
jgi:hypothetical protein